MYVYEALAQALYDNDIHEMFGVVGDANLFIIDSFRTAAGGRYVPTSTEGGAVMAAFGYAQVSGRLAAATSDTRAGPDKHGDRAGRGTTRPCSSAGIGR